MFGLYSLFSFIEKCPLGVWVTFGICVAVCIAFFILCSCGLEMDRDLNAARNILRLGLQSLATQKVA